MFASMLAQFLYVIDYSQYNSIILLSWIISLIISFIFLIRNVKKYCINGNKLNFFLLLKKYFLLIPILILGIFLRFYDLNKFPIVFHDEAKDTGLFPIKILTGEIRDYFGFFAGINNVFFVISTIPHLIFSDPIIKLRFFSALFGSLSIIIVYIYLSKISTKLTAFIGAFLFATYHVLIHFSRSEFLNLFDSFYTLVILLIFYYSTLKKNYFITGIFGLLIGLGFHFYSGIRPVLLISTAIYFVYLLLKTPFKRFLLHVIIYLFFIIVAV